MADLLVVDDDKDLCWMVKQLLETKGHSVRVAHDGNEGLAAMKARQPDAVVLDVEMPELDGPSTACRMFVNDAGLEHIPIVLVSGTGDLRKAATRVGTPYFLPKPFDSALLLSLVDRALVEHVAPRPPDRRNS